jgi:probable F420-dependent oxidoreductase
VYVSELPPRAGSPRPAAATTKHESDTNPTALARQSVTDRSGVESAVMDFGVAIFPTDETIMPARVARFAEERGFESLFFPEHTHIPTARETPWRGGAELPRHYWRVLDPFVSLASAAAATTRLRLGTGVCLVIQRDPIVTAKEVATLDLLSGGRFEFGVGAGWNRGEIENHGTDFKRRFTIMRERIEAMQAIWTQEAASYHGRFVDFESIASWPKPVQRPYPPVLVGGDGPTVLDRVLAYGDAWMPESEEGLAARIAELQRRAQAVGRPRIPVTYFGAERNAAAAARLVEAGVDRILFYLPSSEAGVVERSIDEVADVVASL